MKPFKSIFLAFCELFIIQLALGQSLIQNPYRQYLGQSIYNTGVSFLGETPYDGIGKWHILDQLKYPLSTFLVTSYIDSGKDGTPFGVIYSNFKEANRYRHREGKFSLFANQLSEIQGQLQLSQNSGNLSNTVTAAGSILKNEIDRNDDQFLDLPIKDELFLQHSLRYNGSRGLNVELTTYLLSKDHQGGLSESNHQGNAVFPIRLVSDHLGMVGKFSTRLFDPNPYKLRFIQGRIDAKFHHQADQWGPHFYRGRQRDVNGDVG